MCVPFFFVCVIVALRGQSTDVMILEEAAYMDRSMFFDVVAPLMLVEKTAVLAISSPSDEFNYYSTLLELRRPDGSFVFEQVSKKKNHTFKKSKNVGLGRKWDCCTELRTTFL